MKIIILGAGQVGRTAAYHLAREEANDVTVVDTDGSDSAMFDKTFDEGMALVEETAASIVGSGGRADHQLPKP